MSDRAPELSVVLAARGDSGSIRPTLDSLCAQTAADRVELVLVVEAGRALVLDSQRLAPLRSHTRVEVEKIRSVAAANAAGVRAAAAPVVAFAEDHAFPEPGWAAALIDAHRGPWAAVGPVVINANPGSAVSWADFMLGYGPWGAPLESGPVDYLPGHNSSYKRSLLLELGPELERRLDAECVLHWELRRQGRRLYLDSRARTWHVNFSRLRPWLRASFLQGRAFAAERARSERWGSLRRTAYAAGAPLIPAIRMRRALRDLRRMRSARVGLARVLPAAAAALAVSAAGEAFGYLGGPGGAPEAIARFEFRRDRHVRRADRAVFHPGMHRPLVPADPAG